MTTSAVSSTSNSGQSIITALNAGNGMDITALATNLTAATKAPEQSIIDTKKTALNAQVSSIGKIMTTVDSFLTSLTSLGDPNTFQRSPQTSDSSKLTVEFMNGTVPAAFTNAVSVKSLATESSIRFPPVASLDASLLGSNAIRTLTLNSVPAGSTPLASIDLSVTNTLPKLRDAINNISGMTASIVQGGTATSPEYYLTVKHGTGTANRFTASVTTGDASLTTAPAVTDANGNITTAANAGLTVDTTAADATARYNETQGSDASILVDGVPVSSATNKFDNVIPGVSLTAVGATGVLNADGTISSDTPVTVSSTTNTDSLTNALSTLVSGFNTIIQTVNTETAIDIDPKKRGGLANDTAAKLLLNQLRSFTTQPIAGYDDKIRSFSDLGISTNKDGTLSLDAKAFATKLKTDPSGVEAILASKRLASDSRLKLGVTSANTPTGVYTIQKGDATNWTINNKSAVLNIGILSGSVGSGAEGLSILIPPEVSSAAAIGYSTKIYYSKGIVERFSDMLTSLKDSQSQLQSETTNATAALKNLDADQASLDTRMTAVQQRYMTQFTAMQTLLNQSKDTQSSLTNFMTAWTAGLKSA